MESLPKSIIAFLPDQYTLQARLQPALIVLLPVLVAIVLWRPELINWLSGVFGVAIAFGMCAVLTHLCRSSGKALENQLITEWGAMPTTQFLRHRDRTIDPDTKARYHRALEQNVPQWTAPAPGEEDDDPARADDKYKSAVSWLRENARAAHLVKAENISYGFRRNACALKPYAIVIGLVTLISHGAVSWYVEPDLTPNITSQGAIYFAVGGLLLWWSVVVTKSWVREAAELYATRLLEYCDKMAAPD